ncbi:MAG: UvrB/UvrC motif-containing protein, partial [Phycisphaeraceae bacterium]|nr:UvrB/UvrC motif-containing protein [Phycisphaeraceae bacterium]
GLDLPEVSLVAIMDADKTGFLRSPTSLIQQIGRSARNENATVFLYADTVTDAMQQAIDETARRRRIQLEHNREHDITPKTVQKAIRRGIELELRARRTVREATEHPDESMSRDELIEELESQMLEAAKLLEFEKAAALRDRVKKIKASPELDVADAGPVEPQTPPPGTPGTPPRRKKRRS